MKPKLRFPEFHNTTEYIIWDFADLFEFSAGKNIKQNQASRDFKTPCVRYGELYYMYSEVIYEVINRTILSRDELVFSLGNEILLPSAGEDPLDIGSASALTLPNIAIGRTINVLRPKRDNTYSHIYVSYYINAKLKKKIASLAKGVSISNVYNSDLRTLTAALPSLAEQQKVAELLCKVDAKINLLTKKKEALESYKKGLMQKIFSQELRFKREDGTDFPEWKSTLLGELITEIKIKSDYSNQYPVLTSSRKGIFFQEEYYSKQVASENNTGYNVVPRGCITYRHMSDDLIFKFNENTICDFGIVSTLYPVFAVNPDSASTEFLLLKLNEGVEFKHFCLMLKQGGSRTYMYLNKLKELHLTIPSLDEQNAITQLLQKIDNMCKLQSDLVSNMEKFKFGLLQQMFV